MIQDQDQRAVNRAMGLLLKITAVWMWVLILPACEPSTIGDSSVEPNGELTTVDGRKQTCGNNKCNGKETCETCPTDCGVCEIPEPVCGDSVCDSFEDCDSCVSDCGICDEGNLPPVADFTWVSDDGDAVVVDPETGNYTVIENDGTSDFDEDLNFDGSLSSDPDGDSLTYHWNVESDGGIADSGQALSNQYDFIEGNSYAVSLTVTDTAGNSATKTITLSVIAEEDYDASPPEGPVCGDATCDTEESCDTCVSDCGICPSEPEPAVCGDRVCDTSETCSTCEQDCGACWEPTENLIYVDDLDQNGDGTSLNPFNNIQDAVDAAQHGDTITVRAGTYSSGARIQDRRPSSNEWLVLTAAPGDEHRVHIVGDYIRIYNSENVAVRGFKVTNATYGVSIRGPSAENIYVTNNHIRDVESSGISVWGIGYHQGDPSLDCNPTYACIRNLVIEDNLLERTNNKCAVGSCSDGSGNNEAITVANGVDGVYVRRNVVRGNRDDDPTYERNAGGEGIDFKEGVSNGYIYDNTLYDMSKLSIYLDAGIADAGYYQTPPTLRNIHIFNNRVFNDDYGDHGIAISTEAALTSSADAEGHRGGRLDGIFVYNNIVYGRGKPGISIYAHRDTWELPEEERPFARDIFVFNNTTYSNDDAGISIGFTWARNVHIVNNITWCNDYCARDGVRFVNGTEGLFDVANNLSVDPDYLDPSNALTADYHIAEGSAAIDAGISAAPELIHSSVAYSFDFDHDGRRRSDGALDSGALEYGATENMSSFLASMPPPWSGM
jgi:hypothetical protein